MRVDTSNNNTTFGAIYTSQRANFSRNQEKIAKNIKKTLQRPLKILNGNTPEQYYQKKDVDFLMSPQKDDTILLQGFSGLFNKRKGQVEVHDSFKIGTYGKKDKLNVAHVDKKVEKQNTKKTILNTLQLAAIVGMYTLMTCIVYTDKKAERLQDTKPKTEMADSLVNKTKPLIQDTLNLVKKVKK